MDGTYPQLVNDGSSPPAVLQRDVGQIAVRVVPEVQNMLPAPARQVLQLPHRALVVDNPLLQLGHLIPDVCARGLVEHADGSGGLREEARFAGRHDDHVEEVAPVGAHDQAHACVAVICQMC